MSTQDDTAIEQEARRVKQCYPFRKVYVATLHDGTKEVFAPKDKRAVNNRLRHGEVVHEVIFS